MDLTLPVNLYLLFIFKGNKILGFLLHWNHSHKDVSYFLSIIFCKRVIVQEDF